MNFGIHTTSAREIQRNYKRIFEQAVDTGEPIYVMAKNKPQVAIVSMDLLDRITKQLQWELEDTREAIKIYKAEKKAGTLKKLEHPQDLLKL